MRRVATLALLLLALASGSGSSAQSSPAAPAPQASGRPTFDSNRAWEHLRRQVAIGPRPAGSAAIAECRRYLLEQLAAMGIQATEQAFDADTPLGKVRMVNIVATIPGLRKERIALGSHYDTKIFREFRFVGASDGASSTATLLELGRALKGRSNPFTIELLFFDGEEAVIEWQGTDNTYGSRYYVQAAQKAGTLKSLRAFVLLDMVGDRNLNISKENSSTPWLNDTIWAAARRLGHAKAFPNRSFYLGGDDHFPFLAAGVPSVDIIDFDYPAWHTAGDNLDAVSARSLQITGDVVLEALPAIEQRLLTKR